MVSVGLILTAAVLAALLLLSGANNSGVFTLKRLLPLEVRVEFETIKARDRARHVRILQSSFNGIVGFPVGGVADPYSFGLYYTKVRLGSPPQEFNVQIDTGSDILWVSCSPCDSCPNTSGLGLPLNFFDAATSSTVSSISCSDARCASMVRTASAECPAGQDQCGYSFQYGDGSGTNGFYVSDLLYYGTILGTSSTANSSASIVFGCSNARFEDLAKSEKAVDGIIGFGQHDLSVISQLASHGITPKVFSHCLKGDGNGGGILVLGEILDPRIVYTPLVPSQPHYNLYLQSIAVNGQLLPIDQAVFRTSGNQGTIVDSGTTLSYLVEGAYDPFVAAINAAISPSVKPIIHHGKQCYLVLTSVAETFPVVALNFAGGASMVLKPVDYLVTLGYVDGSAMWCMGFVKVQDPGTTILGDLVLKDKIFVYDLAHQRIGWADYDCSLPVNVSITSSRDKLVNAGQLSVSSGSQIRTLFKLTHASNFSLTLDIMVLVACLVL